MKAVYLLALLLFSYTLLSKAETPASHLIILQYHHVSTDTPAATSLSPTQFNSHMEWLADNGYQVTALPAALQKLHAGEHLADKSVAITFDDGYRDIYTHGFPALKARGWPFTLFVNTEPHDAGHPAWASWDEIREMTKAGGSIANHTASHPFMVRKLAGETDADWLQRLEQEITSTEKRIKEQTGQSHRLLAYPYGESNTAIHSLVAELGYTAFGQQSGPTGPDSNPTDLPRFPLSGHYAEMDSFATKMRSLPMAVINSTPDSESGDGTLMHAETNPTLIMELRDKNALTLNCFASGQGAIPVKALGAGRYAIKASDSLPVGRSRYNCTYASNDPERYYWFSYAWVRQDENNRWTHN